MSNAIHLPLTQVLIAASCAAVLLTSTAHAGDDTSRRQPLNATYVAECGTCHVAYPPRLLRASAWRLVMSKLDKHFGTDAKIDAASHATIQAYLDRTAGTKASPSPSDKEPPRLTDSEWFKREHRSVAAATWSKPAVKSRANCSACHTRAEAGSYREREITLPK